jgi:hypothetical protein
MPGAGHRWRQPNISSLAKGRGKLGSAPVRILMPGFHVRDRPDRASPRRTKKAGDFPARKPQGSSYETALSSFCRSPGG